MTVLALDTSVAVPLVVASHRAHVAVSRWWDGRDVVLSGPATVETYSVLTRLPGDLRPAPRDAARLLRERFGAALATRVERARPTYERVGVTVVIAASPMCRGLLA